MTGTRFAGHPPDDATRRSQPMLLNDLVETSSRVKSASGRLVKIGHLADLLAERTARVVEARGKGNDDCVGAERRLREDASLTAVDC